MDANHFTSSLSYGRDLASHALKQTHDGSELRERTLQSGLRIKLCALLVLPSTDSQRRRSFLCNVLDVPTLQAG
jgi:hypothetical protein